MIHNDPWPANIASRYLKHFMATTPKIIMDHARRFSWRIQNLSELVFLFRICFESFWGRFSWLTIAMPPEFYMLAFILTCTGAIGLIKSLGKNLFQSDESKEVFILMLLSFVIIFILSFYVTTYYFHPQGRYFFPAIAPIAIGFSLGWLSWFKKENLSRMTFVIVATSMVTMNILAYVVCILRTYSI